MLKSLINFRGVEVLGKEEQKNIIGKGPIKPQCKTWAPIGANAANYPNYPCAEIYAPVPEPCWPTLLEDGTVLEC
ncbi:hypothetical protein Q1W71_04525 [Flavobacterium pectinovorum]|uniref:hypothetical protein n=1 Tax=Flavobacterium pectinovorum TaxID=29533 RepID=UPI00265DE199|nr:hypothetical protein [Flavobacterium pectinovorum]WKL49052.1 hypothetical protein Q1W71_04525 [Flavobacterium pectinovorum]